MKTNSLNISKTNIWHSDANDIDLSFVVDKDAQYRILVNNQEIVPLSEVFPAMIKINIKVPTNQFVLGENNLKVEISADGDLTAYLNIVIKKEDRETFTFKRSFNFKEDYIIDENIIVVDEIGIGLKETGTGDFILNIPTEGKSTVKNILIDDGEKELESLIPIMNAASVNGFSASATNNYSTNYPWKAFNGDYSEYNSWISTTKAPVWLRINLPNLVKVCSYSIVPSNVLGAPKMWRLEASLNGTDWITIDTRERDTPAIIGKEERYNIKNETEFQRYRLFVTNNNNYNYVYLGGFQLYKETDTHCQVLLPMVEPVKLQDGMIYRKTITPAEFVNSISEMNIKF
jgi:hypothetical protein